MLKTAITLQVPKPRATRLAETMAGRHGGRMRSARDYDRRSLKQELRQAMARNHHA